MLGCVGSRDKSGAQSSVLPLQAWAVSPRIDKVVFEFGLQFTGCKALDFESVSVTVQMLEAGTLTSSWVALPGARWRPLDPSVVSEAGRAALGIGHDEAGWEESRKFLSNGSLLRSSLTSQPRGDDGEGDGPVPKDVAVGTKETEASPFSIAADGSAGSGAPADSASASGGVANVGDGAAANVCDSPAVSSVAASGAMFSAAGDGVNDAPTATASFLPSVDAAITNALRGEIRVVKIGCSAEVSGLRPEKDYTLQVLARGSPRETYASCEPFVCRTADRPSLTTCQLTRVYRWADGVEVEWVVPDPAGAPVEECSALCRIESLLSSWAEAESEFATVEVLPQNPGAVQLVPGETEKRGRRWRGFIHGLKGATSYYVRARARNAVGWSLNTSPDLQLATSDMPPSPTELATIGRRPTSVVLSFVMHDPEGSPVETCAAQIRGLMGYVPHPNCRWEHTRPAADEDGRYPKGERRALCIMQGLSPEQSYVVRLWTQNGSGTSKTPSVALQVSTSERPAAPSQLSAKVGPRAIEVEWDLVDPLGAPVEHCDLEYSRDSMFGAWETVAAEPVAVVSSDGVPNFNTFEMAAAVSVAEVTASTTLTRRWRVRLDHLEREAGYVARARARNTVAWCTSSSPVVHARTSDRPPSPQNVRCTSRLPVAVQLEFSVDEVLGTAPVSSVHVEQSGSLSWQEIHEVEVTKASTSTSDRSDWVVLVMLGMSPGVTHKLRVWASNPFGRCSEPSATVSCCTSDRPDPPANLVCASRMPHSLVLRWHIADPEGAKVTRCEVQVRRDQAFSSWHLGVTADTIREDDDPQTWRCVVEQLEPGTAYHVCVRALNDVGWSEWRPGEIGFETSRPPPAARQLKVFRNEMNGLIVNAVVDDPDGAPVVACMVKCREQGLWALARRDGSVNGSWRATLSVLGGSESSNENAVTAALVAAGSRVTIIVRAANSVGWSEGSVCEKPEFLSQEADDGNALADVVPRDGSNSGQDSGLDLVVKEVQRAIERQRESKVRINKLLAQASSRGDHEHAASLARHCVEIERRMEVLQQVAQHVDPSLEPVASATPAAEDQGVQIVSQIQAEMKKHNLLPNAPAAAKVLALLLRGYIWLETVWRSELSFLSAGISQAMEAVPETGSRILHQWAKRHQSWSESFNRKVNAALPEGLATATQLLSTLVSGRKLELFKTVRSDMEACTTLLAAAERQLRKLRQSYRILHAAEAASCHKFEGKGVLQKIETTALGLITMMVLPVPGSLEVGTVGIAMLWLEGDMAGSHLALQHPSGTLLGPMLQRLGSCPPPRAAVILAGWASGGHRGVVLVHNATARRITVTALSDVQSLGSRAFSKLSEAHPMVRMLGPAMNLADGGDHVVTILPTDVALIQVPDTGGPGGDTVKLEFAYGPSAHMEKAMGRAVVKPGTAVSFMHLDGTLQVSNIEGDNTSVEEGTVTVINNELAQCSVSLFRAPEAQKHFESPLQVEILQPGEEKQLPVPHPCIGRIFQVEVKDDTNHKSICEVRPGQRLVIECCGTPA
eukprot:TRINITY_DN20813_c0_g4_i3.p1 TRINITY_DN20813_c0_g4~~TRINITY_DN20813_c0_g4_i3.p1  ORF type:complete len:1540 (-),score=264.42 TRINITY_DN20813_c0_g4_i3:24-4601(-)